MRHFFRQFARQIQISLIAISMTAASVATAESGRSDHVELDAHRLYARQTFSKYCFECHSEDYKEANFSIEALLDERPLVRNRTDWQRVMQVVEMGAMPPDYAEQPAEIERANLLAHLDAEIVRFDYSSIDNPGYEPVRRLTHRQYNNTIRDLFGIDLQPAERFPEELTGSSGFDNSANTLFLQTSLMERYIAAAEGIVSRALPPTPSSEEHRRAHDLIFVAQPSASLSEEEAADAVLRRFLLRAFRRPPASTELQSARELYASARAAGQDFHSAVRGVLTAVLISPKFLLRIEADAGTSEPYRINDWELASRLSYFMWSSMPDDELFALAAGDRLSKPAVLSAQVERMLADPKADELGDAFAAQWFSTRLVGGRIRLDPIDNPWCTDSLMTAMRRETSMFFVSLLRENRPIGDLIASDYTFVNEELAKTLYRWNDVEGEQMRRASVEDPNRGGILAQPAVLTVTSSFKDTSPIKRGIFVLDTLLGTPPPPPPPDAGEISPQLRRNRNLSFREKLEMHSSDASCRVCHAQIDPLGFALENFDYFGRWRDYYGRRQEIDNTARLESGATFVGPAGLKEFILNHRHEELVRQTTSKLLAFALGRQLEYFDEPALREIEQQLAADEFRFQTLLQAVVSSYPFQYRKNPLEEAVP